MSESGGGRKPELRIGISGWRYPPWRGVFYPRGLPQRRELEFAAGQLNSIEINGSFYSLQRPESYLRWRAETPDGFVFAVKGPRYISHMLRLRNARTALANFFASGVLALDDRLGPVLWQLPENLPFDEEQLAGFFRQLPRSTRAAAELARDHDDKVDGRTFPADDAAYDLADRPLRHALEARSPTFVDPRLAPLLREHDVGLVIADTAKRWPMFDDVTSDFVYLRLHGAEELYVSGYTDEQLEHWAERVRGWTARGLDVYAYFDNDAKVHSPFDALGLRGKLAEPEPEPKRTGNGDAA
ncbi:DUF72 domain-containing protein [Glaciibacter sp. 2TAF33]|uniref:DUF72 domain-containing protein n=1 Tax=Glaciibacter sp. 2TAF33 TaxID=3233015 RepID=UPI003F92E621